MRTRADALALDAADPLAGLGTLFDLPEAVIYLDGNSLGATPRTAAARLASIVGEEWSGHLISAWNRDGWFELPRRLGDKLAPLIGARADEVVVTDTTSSNLFKVLHAAAAAASAADPARTVIVSERTSFPTDLYVAQSVCAAHGMELRLFDAEALPAALDERVAAVLLTEVNYRTGAWWKMGEVTAKAHDAGALAVWDLCHSAGAVPVDLHAADADFAVGCTYKYLNGGPGSPAFVWAHPRHADSARHPLSGWWGHAAPFAFEEGFLPAGGARRWLGGTQPILSLALVECGLDTVLAGAPGGDMSALRAKSIALTEAFIALVDERLGDQVTIVSPRPAAERGSQVSLSVERAYAVVQALIARGVIGDFRAGVDGEPDLARFGFAPLYVGFTDVWDAVEHLADVLDGGEHHRAEFNVAHQVT